MIQAHQDGAFRIVVMDDEPLVLGSVVMLLESVGHEVVSARHGQEVIDLLADKQSVPYDLIIADLTVRAGLGAVEIVEAVRSAAPNVKLVVSSGYANDPVMRDHRAAGFDDKLTKPYGAQHLSALIERLRAVEG